MEKVQVYSEKEGKYVDVDVINKDNTVMVPCVMLVVDEEE